MFAARRRWLHWRHSSAHLEVDMPAPATAEPAAGISRVDAADYRKVLGRVPTAVSVVTATAPHGPVGVTVGSFTSVSLDPPLVVFYCNRSSASAAAIVAAGRFCVNVLAEDQQDQCAAFAARDGDRFGACAWDTAANGAPRIAGCLAWIECEVESSFPAGDHVAVVGRVTRLAAADGGRNPLVFYRGRLARLDRDRVRHAPTHPFDWWGA
jgi:flavin reductase (DIM6/NTAB) family NADH-FMN oxidoreductase RutF